MHTTAPSPPSSKAMLWSGYVVTALVVVMLGMSAVMKFSNSQELTESLDHLGWPQQFAIALGITELTCVILYAIPQTHVLGAILITGYMGGAIASHARIGEMFVVQIVIGMVAWVGPFLRDPRLRALIPWRRSP